VRPPFYNPLPDGDFVDNPPPIDPIDPIITTDDDDGDGEPPSDEPGDPPPDDDPPPDEDPAQNSKLTEDERRRAQRCHDGEWDQDPILYWSLDYTVYQEAGRPVGVASGAEACFVGGHPSKGPRTRVTPPGWVTGLVRSHLIARSLGGDGRRYDNMVPFCPGDNRRMWDLYESIVKTRTEMKETVYYRVEPKYEPGNPVPISIHIVIAGEEMGEWDSYDLPNSWRDGECKLTIPH